MTEREVIVELYKSGWQPEEIVLIADASGQVAEQRITAKGGVSAGHLSYDLSPPGDACLRRRSRNCDSQRGNARADDLEAEGQQALLATPKA